MTDENKLQSESEKVSTTKKTAGEPVKAAKVTADKSVSTKKSTASAQKISPNTTKTPWSKLALFSFLLSLLALSAIGYGYIWLQQEQAVFKSRVVEDNNAQLTQMKAANKKLFDQQQMRFDQQLANVNALIAQENQVMIDKLKQTVERLSATQPTDWLVHEAEYLIRVAGRTIWLERDTRAAIGLLQDADLRLVELNDPQFLTVRQQINQDIEMLKLLPTLNTEQIILTLMGLAQQAESLPLALVQTPEVKEENQALNLSSSTDDWQENLSKSWQRFMADFITVRKRSERIEPLLTPQQKGNLFANLKLKLQQAQWAASKEKTQLYQQSLLAVQAWQETYFDMNNSANQSFHQTIENLKTEQVFVEYPNELTALTAIRNVLRGQNLFELEIFSDSDKKEAIDTKKEKLAPKTDDSELDEAIKEKQFVPDPLVETTDEAAI